MEGGVKETVVGGTEGGEERGVEGRRDGGRGRGGVDGVAE